MRNIPFSTTVNSSNLGIVDELGFISGAWMRVGWAMSVGMEFLRRVAMSRLHQRGRPTLRLSPAGEAPSERGGIRSPSSGLRIYGQGKGVPGVGGVPGITVGGPGTPFGPGVPGITVAGVPGVPGV